MFADLSLLQLPAAALFALLLLGGLWLWRWRHRRPIHSATVQAIAEVSAVRRILVPVHGTAYNDRAVELACRLGAAQKAEVVAVYVIEVPLALSLTTPPPGEIGRARECLERAQEIIEHHGLKAHIEMCRERDVARGILKVAKEQSVHMVVLGINPKNLAAGESVGKTTEHLLRKSHIEVIVDMHPENPEGEEP